MQQLMTLEVDIILGQTENSMKYLKLNQKKRKGSVGAKNSKDKDIDHRKISDDRKKKIIIQSLNNNATEDKGHTNRDKI